MAEMSNEEMLAMMQEMMAEKKKKDTVVGAVAANGGGALAGGYIGYLAGGAVAVALAPLTGGLSLVIPPLMGIGGAVVGHKAGKKLDD
jgi:hypothetical protein